MEIDDLVQYINGDKSEASKNKSQNESQKNEQDREMELLSEAIDKDINESDVDEFKKRIQTSE